MRKREGGKKEGGGREGEGEEDGKEEEEERTIILSCMHPEDWYLCPLPLSSLRP